MTLPQTSSRRLPRIRTGSIRHALPWLWLLFCYLLTVASLALHGAWEVDADMSSEMVLAELLNREGGILSPNWYYSTELRVFDSQLAYKLGLLLFDRWHAAWTFAGALMLLVMAASYLFLMRSLEPSHRSFGLWSAGILVLPFSSQYMFAITHGQFYTPKLALVFLSLGSCLRAARAKSRTAWLWFAAGCLTALIAGMAGTRMLIMVYAPLTLASALFLIPVLRSPLSIPSHTPASRGRWRTAARSLMRESFRLRLLLLSCGMALANLVGMLFEARVLADSYTYSHGYGRFSDSLSLLGLTVSGVLDYLGETVRLFGYSGVGEVSMGSETIVALTALAATSLLLLLYFLCVRFRGELTESQRFLVLYTAVALPLSAFVFWAGGNPATRYLLPAAILLLPLAEVSLFRVFPDRSPGRFLGLAALLLLFLLQSYKLCLSEAFHDGGRSRTDLQVAAAWLADHGYERGYASFWNGNILRQFSDGRLEVWVIEQDEEGAGLIVLPWLQDKRHVTEVPEGQVFLLLQEGDQNLPASIPGGREVFRTGDLTVYDYPDAQPIQRLRTDSPDIGD